MSHKREICPHGQVVGSCRCAGPKDTFVVPCPVPGRHADRPVVHAVGTQVDHADPEPAQEPLEAAGAGEETPEEVSEPQSGAEPVEPQVFTRVDAARVVDLLVSGRGRRPSHSWSEAERQAEKRLYAYVLGRIDGERTEPAPLDPTPAIVAAITEAFPHQEACRFPDTVCECGAAETRRRTATLIADLRLTQAPEPAICRYGHTEADHEAAGACVRKPRPHWLPEQAWLGVVVGQWPLRAFTDQAQAERWAAEAKWEPERQEYEHRRIWSVDVPTGTQTFKVETVPAATKLVEAKW